jgi:hypothetical protein
MLEKCRRLMDACAEFCAKPSTSAAADVMSLRQL